MFIVENSAELRLFVAGYADAPLQGSGQGLDSPTLPIWSLFRVGEWETQPHQAHILGLNFSAVFELPLPKRCRAF